MSKLLWKPSADKVLETRMHRFMVYVNERFGKEFSDYSQLYQWSVTEIPDFWAAAWDFLEIKASRSYDQVVDDLSRMPGAKWFPEARLNFTENLLRYRDDKTALVFLGEDQASVYWSYTRLYDETARVAQSLKRLGVVPGDRVVAYMPNLAHTIIAMLAAVSLGATWSSCSPDFGTKGVLDRFGQIQPKVLFAADGYFFKGKRIDILPRLEQIAQQIPSVEHFIVVPYAQPEPDISGIRDAMLYADFRSDQPGLEIDFAQLPADHPLYIMYSSGTTGLPKCMVQGAAGILINQLKEMVLHTDVGREDKVFYFTTCGWMMWNWLTSGLATGATVVLYDGNPVHPGPEVLWQMAQDQKLTVFGTSAGYLGALENTGMRPGDRYDLSHLRALLSTGSPLAEEGFAFVYDAIKSDLQLASISGGTDLNGCFALGNPIGPVYSGELQCRGLGMKVEVFDENGQAVVGRQGELVCTAPFPSMPLYFWDDPNNQYTLNMKKVELAVKKVIEKKPVQNRDSLSNPDVLDFYANLKEVYED